jgi:hypothetical protein
MNQYPYIRYFIYKGQNSDFILTLLINSYDKVFNFYLKKYVLNQKRIVRL